MPAIMTTTSDQLTHASVVSAVHELYGEDTDSMTIVPSPANDVIHSIQDKLRNMTGKTIVPRSILAYTYIENYGGGAIVKLK